jgi:hypothetical protein
MMQTKNVYCGDGWEFEITTVDDENGFYIDLKNKAKSVKKWELQELADFIKKFLNCQDHG